MEPFVVTVDNRVRMPLEALERSTVDDLVAAFTHENPRYPDEGTPFERTYKIDEEDISLPRGGMSRVREILQKNGEVFRVRDVRTAGDRLFLDDNWGGRPIPRHNVTLWEWQQEAVQAILVRQNCILRAATGCLAGDTVIELNRAGKSFKLPITDVVHRFNGGRAGNRTWDLEVPTRVRSCDAEGFLRLHTLMGAYASGEKTVYRLRTEGGRSIRATADHRFMTTAGFKRLARLRVGDFLYVDGGVIRAEGEKKKKAWYNQVDGLTYHPHASRKGIARGKGWSVPEHRLVAEARMNCVALSDFIRACRDDLETAKDFSFLDPAEYAVHHLDENPRNNAPQNLVVKTHSDHSKEHGEEGGWKNVTARIALDRIVEISEMGREQTYDLAMRGEPRNFLANGFVVHNSGKTTAGLATYAAADVPTLVVVWTGGLLDQWVERLCKEMDLRKEDIGIIGGGKRRTAPITIAMQQTLAEGIDQRWLRGFGAIICDEVHRFAADSFFAAIDPFPAKYRVGMSADETRHDKREYLIHDLFGDVVADIKEQDVLDAGHVVDVEIRVVPTDFEANWYRAAVASGNKFYLRNAHHKLLRAMWEDKDRNYIIKKLVKSEVKAGEQVMVLSQRREHCLLLDREFTAAGITSGIMLGGAEAKSQFNQTKEDVRTGKARVITGTISAIGTGLDFPAIGRGIVTMPIANNKQLMQQVRGRFCRACEETGKTKGVLYYLWDRAVHGRKPLENLVRHNRTVLVLNNRGEWGKETWVEGKVVLGSMRSGIKGRSVSKLRRTNRHAD